MSMAKSNYKTIVISILDNFKKKSLSIWTLEVKVLIFGIKKVDITMINTNTYQTAYKLKKARVFAIFMKNLEYQVEKEAKSKTNPKTIILEKYQDFLDVFSQKNSDILFSNQKYDHKIILEKE